MLKHPRKFVQFTMLSAFLLCQSVVHAERPPSENTEQAQPQPKKLDIVEQPIHLPGNPQEKLQSRSLEVTQATKTKNTSENAATQPNKPWLENIHSTVADSVFDSARWFDDFFNDDDSNQLNPQTNFRVRVGWIPEEGDWETIEPHYRLRLKLPHLKDKVDFIFSDDDSNDEQNTELEDVATNQKDEFERFTAAIRYVHSQTLGALLDSRLGVASGDIFYRIRYKKRIQLGETQSIKFEPSVYYFIDDGLGSKTLLEYNYNLSSTSQLRASSTLETSEKYQGTKWGQGLHKLTQFDDKSASSFGLQVNGIHKGESGTQVEVYHLAYRYRFNAIRKWLFFEVEPFYQWRAVDNYHPTVGIALRIEGHFIKN